MSANMVERVARAMVNGDTDGDAWPMLSPSSQETWLKKARYAIEAMREPTLRMHNAGEGTFFRAYTGTHTSEPSAVWRAMLAAALEE